MNKPIYWLICSYYITHQSIMKRIFLTTVLFLGVAFLSFAQIAPAAMTLSTNAFADGTIIPVKYSQAAPGAAPGEGTSPALSWGNIPAGTKSLLLHMHDLDFVRNKTTDDQVHWLVWNIPANATGLPEGLPRGAKLPDGSYQISVTGPVYRGPGAAASGPLHHYMFEILALDITLDFPAVNNDPFETRAKVMQTIQGHILGKAVTGGLFKRPLN
jgi:Raf kinase inhibitor-like YbhB/YbcL family protein